MGVIGTPVRRREDYRFLTGQGTYTDDINRPGQLHAYILRSPHANARITGIDTSAAAAPESKKDIRLPPAVWVTGLVAIIGAMLYFFTRPPRNPIGSPAAKP